jgi:hypothetical protein
MNETQDLGELLWEVIGCVDSKNNGIPLDIIHRLNNKITQQ